MRSHIQCVLIALLVHVSSAQQWTRYNTAGKSIDYTRTFSEENSGYSGRQTAPVAGIVCSGRYCDSKRLIVVRDGDSRPVQNSAHWTHWFTDGNNNWADCPSDMIVNEIQCRGRYCDDMRLQCGKLETGYRVVASDIRTVDWFSEEQGERRCQDGYYLWGMACRGDFCDGIKLNCARIDYIPPSSDMTWKTLVRNSNTIVRSKWFSEEARGYSGRMSGPVAGISCSGRYCDNKQLISVQRGADYGVENSGYWTHWFTDGDPDTQSCPSDMVMNEIQCRGRYCDDMRLQCGRMASGYRVVRSDTAVVNWFSEEEGERLCPDGYYVVGISCRGDYCDGIRLECARVQYDPRISPPPPPSDGFLANKFAPQMRFDQKGSQFPLPASVFWEQSSTNGAGQRVLPPGTTYRSPFDPDSMGLSYTISRCGERTKITYWALYKGQQPCAFGAGDHEGDWEHIVVELSPDFQAIFKVQFAQHGGWYTRFPGSMDTVDGTHVVAYVGKNSNGQYHDDGGSGGCLYYEDFRNTGDSGKIWNSWQRGRLLPTDTGDPWNTFSGSWGRDGIRGPNPQDTWHGGVCRRNHCDDDGCSKSQT